MELRYLGVQPDGFWKKKCRPWNSWNKGVGRKKHKSQVLTKGQRNEMQPLLKHSKLGHKPTSKIEFFCKSVA